MAERRMFSKTIIDSDDFLDMPFTAQLLYFHLSMRADDDGFINNARKIIRMIGLSDDDLKLLIAENFIISFESGIVAIKHWKMHNYIAKDRYKPTVYQKEKNLLEAMDTKCIQDVDKMSADMDTSCIQAVYKPDTQVRSGKVSIDKVSSDKESSAKKSIDLSEYNINEDIDLQKAKNLALLRNCY